MVLVNVILSVTLTLTLGISVWWILFLIQVLTYFLKRFLKINDDTSFTYEYLKNSEKGLVNWLLTFVFAVYFGAYLNSIREIYFSTGLMMFVMLPILVDMSLNKISSDNEDFNKYIQTTSLPGIYVDIIQILILNKSKPIARSYYISQSKEYIILFAIVLPIAFVLDFYVGFFTDIN